MYYFTSNEWIHQILWKQGQRHVFYDERWWNVGKIQPNLVCDRNKVGNKFYSEPVYEEKYLKTKVREFDGVIKTNFLGNDGQNNICIILALLA